MEAAAEVVRNFRQHLRDFIEFMEDNSGDETPRLRSVSVSDRDMEQVGPEIDTSGEGHRVAAPDTSDNSGGFYTREHRLAASDTSNNFGGFYIREHRLAAASDTSDNSGGFYTREHRLAAPDTSSNSGGLFGGHRGAAHSGGLFGEHRAAAHSGGLFGGHGGAAPDTSNNPGGLFGGHRGAAHSGGLFGGHRGAPPDTSNRPGGLFGGHRGVAPDTINRPGGLFAPDTSNRPGGLFGGHRGETSLNLPGVATANRNGFFDGFYTGEDHDNSTRHMRGTLWPELPSMPGRFPPSLIPVQPPMQPGVFGRLYAGDHHDDSSLNMPGSPSHVPDVLYSPGSPSYPRGTLWPEMPSPSGSFTHDPIRAPSMQRARENLLDQLPDISLDDISNATDCNICMEPFGSTEDPESPVQLPCGHVMGRKCISRWLETSNSCPLCRRVLFGQVRGFQSEQEPSALFWQGTFSRVWNNLEPRLQELVRSMTAQEQRHLLQALEESTPSGIETVQIEQVEIPGGSPEEVEAYRVELREISRQRAAIHARLAELEGEDGLLTSQTATELIELGAGYEALRTRLDNYHARINFTSFN